MHHLLSRLIMLLTANIWYSTVMTLLDLVVKIDVKKDERVYNYYGQRHESFDTGLIFIA